MKFGCFEPMIEIPYKLREKKSYLGTLWSSTDQFVDILDVEKHNLR